MLDAGTSRKMMICRNKGTYFALGIACLVLQGCHLGRAKRSNPEYLRSHHAGLVRLSSPQPVRTVFDRVAVDARKCYVGGGVDMLMPVGGLFLPIPGPERSVEARFDEGSNRGVIRGFIDGNVYMPMFQVDVREGAKDTQLDVYYSKDVGMQRAVPENVRAWLAGDDAACSFKSSKSH